MTSIYCYPKMYLEWCSKHKEVYYIDDPYYDDSQCKVCLKLRALRSRSVYLGNWNDPSWDVLE